MISATIPPMPNTPNPATKISTAKSTTASTIRAIPAGLVSSGPNAKKPAISMITPKMPGPTKPGDHSSITSASCPSPSRMKATVGLAITSRMFSTRV